MRRIAKSWSNGRLLAAAADFLSAHAEVVLVTPGHLAGEGWAYASPGVAGLHRMTLIQLAADVARPAMAELALAPLSSLGVEAVCARVIHASRGEDELKYFSPVAELPGFARALSRTIGELRLAGVEPEELAATGAPGADLARLLTRYQDELKARSLADRAMVFRLAAAAATEGNHRWLELPVLMLDAPLDSNAARDFFTRVAGRAPVLLAAVTTGEEGLEKMLGVTAEDLDRNHSDSGDAGQDAGSLERLRRYLFSVTPPAAQTPDSGLEVFSSPGEGLEAVEIARRILRLAGEGVAFDRIAILLRAPERYQPLIEEALRRAKIPAYFSRGTVRPDPSGRAFLALLACAAEKCSASRFAEYLSLGQVPPAGETGAPQPREVRWVGSDDELLARFAEATPDPASESPDSGSSGEAASDDRPDAPVSSPVNNGTLRAPWGWEKLLVDAAVIGGPDRWARRLRGLEREFELRLNALEREDEPARLHLARQREQLLHLERFALPLIGALAALPVAAKWDEWLARLAALARLALRHPDPVLSVLAEFEPMGEVGPATLEEVAEVLEEQLRFLRREPPERRYGRVFIGSVDESRGREFAAVFLPGLAEGLFPQRSLEDPLLLDEFRRQLPRAEMPTRNDRVAEERLRLRLAVAAARDRLVASYPRMDASEARPRVPSFYALELPRAVEGRLPEVKEFENRAREAAPARLNWPAPAFAADAIDDAEYDLVQLSSALAQRANPPEAGGSARYLLEVNSHLARSLRGRWMRWHGKWTEADGLIARDPASLAALAEHRLTMRPWSPSSLQHFAECPYKFALHGIHGLRPREDAAPLEQMDPLTRGALFHTVQFSLLGELKQAGLLPVNAGRLDDALTRADRALDRVAGKYRDDLAPAIPRVWQSEIEDLRTDLRGWLQHVASNDDDWEPRHFEFAFGLRESEGRDPASTLDDVALAEGVRLRGSIDLVEKHTVRDVWRVTDHKTGKCPDPVPAYVGGGKLLQPLLYALAAQQLLGATVESGRLFYATQRGGYEHVLIQLNGKARQFLARLLENIDGAISSGFLPPAPEKDACKICDYRVVCGPYEELRFAQYKDRRDERLEPLAEIRGML